MKRTITILPSLSRTTTTLGSPNLNLEGKGLAVVVDVTTAGTGSITITVKGYDPVSAKSYNILVSAAITTNSVTVLKIYPGLTAAANLVANDFVPSSFIVDVTHNNANAITYSVSALLIL